ncbi:MAG: DNA recombination protein RmuC [Actinomycetota bacterium]
MDLVGLVIGLLLGAALGGALAVTWGQRRLAEQRERSVAETTTRVAEAGEERARLERRVHDAVLQTEQRARTELTRRDQEIAGLRAELARAEASQRDEGKLLEAFDSHASKALDQSTRRFLDLAQERFARLEASAKQESTDREQAVQGLVGPVQQHLDKLAQQLERVEHQRRREAGSLTEMLGELQRTTSGLQGETRTLASAMKDVRARGSWGELQLRRVVELAGMVAHCDFDEQLHVTGTDRSGRPDLVVWLPHERAVVVDSKVPLDAYLEATHSDDPKVVAERYAAHAAAMRAHARSLAKRDYASAVDGAVDIVVMFVPGESFLAAACEHDPTLLDQTLRDGVVLATPTTLVALLKAVALGWREERLADDARHIAELGRELLERTVTFTDHLARVGRGLESSVKHYNSAIGSLESRLLPSARRLAEHGATSPKELPSLSAVDLVPRALTASEDDEHDEDGTPPRLVS